MEVLSGFHDHWFILQTAFLLVVIIVIIVISVLFVATAAVQCSFITPPTVSPFKLYHFLCSIATPQTIPLPVSSTRNCTVLLIRVSSVSSCITVVNSYHFCN